MSKSYDNVHYDATREGVVVYEHENSQNYQKLVEGDQNEQSTSFTSNKRKMLVTLCILLTEMCERLTYYSIIANMILFGTSVLKYSQTDATTINQVFAGFVYIIPIFGGYMSDSFFGRYKTILASGCIYIIGLVLIPAAAVDWKNWGATELSTESKRAIFLSGLAFVALGTGGIKANVGPFGAEQVLSLGKSAVQRFFNWFYWMINIGALVAYAGSSFIQQEVSFAWGYFIPLASMIISLIIFVVASKLYSRTIPTGSALTEAFKILRSGCCKKPNVFSGFPDGDENKILASAKQKFGGPYPDNKVDGVVSVLKLTPFCLLVIMYWTIYAQMTNTFFAQGERMDVQVGGTNLPVAALNVFNTISLILFIPIVDLGLYPCMEKLGKPLSYLKRIGIGLLLIGISVVVAGIVEIYRKKDLNEPGGMHVQVLGDESFNASSTSVFVQAPQFALIGLSEIFTSVTSLEFAYNQSPVEMQGLVTGLFLAASGVGNWLSSAILLIVKEATKSDPWWSDEINNAKMENLMFLFGGIMAVNVFVFVIVAHFYKYQDPSKFARSSGNGLGESNDETIHSVGGSYFDEKRPLKNSFKKAKNSGAMESL